MSYETQAWGILMLSSPFLILGINTEQDIEIMTIKSMNQDIHSQIWISYSHE